MNKEYLDIFVEQLCKKYHGNLLNYFEENPFNNIQKEWAQRLLYETRAHLVDLLNQGYISCDETNYTVNKSFPNLTITPKGEWFIRKSIIAKWSYIIAFTVPVAMAAWISLAQAIKKFF